MSSRFTAIIFIVVLALITLSSAIFFVDERERVILLRLGQIERADFEPGIHFKIPFVNEVRRFDGRILSLDATPARYLTGEKKNVIVDSFVLWRVANVADYFTSMGVMKKVPSFVFRRSSKMVCGLSLVVARFRRWSQVTELTWSVV